ncbi:MAG: hypothetical protein JWO03_2406 [Bacteroidetes bacterium]|nr:hypothetical protein [Bacteroidota bacterium]
MLAFARANISIDIAAACVACESAIELSRTEHDQTYEGEARHLHAQVLFSQGQIPSAIEQIRKAIALRETIGDRLKISVSLNSLGIFLNEIGDYSGALESSFRSLCINEEIDNKRLISIVLINIGSIYHRLNNPSEEMKTYERSLLIAAEIGDKSLIAANHLNLGLLYTNQGGFERAQECLDGLSELFISLKDSRNAINALNAFGTLCYKSKQYDKALEKYFACIELSRETGNSTGMELALMNIGETKIRMGLVAEAKPFLDEAIALAEKNSQRSILKEAKLILVDYYNAMGDFKNAFDALRSYSDLKDELLNIQNLKQLGELKLKYDFEKKEKEAEINHLKNIELKQAFDNLHHEKMRSDKLLLNILPEEVAEELKQTGTSPARFFEAVSVMFIDIANFTSISQQLSPAELVGEIDFIFRGFDEIISRYRIEKIKTIGDAYMCVAGIPVQYDDHAAHMADAALDMLSFIDQHKKKKITAGKVFFEIRIGINSGAVVAGIVGSSKFAYDIWGDTVNTAARMQQNSEVGRINVSGDTYLLLHDRFQTTHRGKIYAKNKGEVDMYFLDSKIGG